MALEEVVSLEEVVDRVVFLGMELKVLPAARSLAAPLIADLLHPQRCGHQGRHGLLLPAGHTTQRGAPPLRLSALLAPDK